MSQPRTLPHNSEAEGSVIGAILLKGQEALGEVIDLIKPEDFYVPAFQALFKAMVGLQERGEPIDVVTLEASLRATEELRLVGGIERIVELSDRYTTAHNVAAHADLIRQKAHVRNLVIAAREIADEGMSEVEDVRGFIDQSEQKLLKINEQGRRSNIQSSKELMFKVFQGIHERQKRNDPITGVATHFKVLDEMTAGLQPSDLIILAARPSMGKTAFALNMAQNACIPQARHLALPPEERPRL